MESDKLVDPEGKDFEKIIDHEKKTITIQAQFYYFGDNKEYQEYVRKAANNWNACNFIVSIHCGDGNLENYTVCFDINNGKGPSNNVSFLPDNMYEERHPGESGGITNGSCISIKNSSITNNQILAHEMGHCLGMNDIEIDDIYLMFHLNDSKRSILELEYYEISYLLKACGFNFGKGAEKKYTSYCVKTETKGIEPIGFWDAIITEKNVLMNNTKKFTQ